MPLGQLSEGPGLEREREAEAELPVKQGVSGECFPGTQLLLIKRRLGIPRNTQQYHTAGDVPVVFDKMTHEDICWISSSIFWENKTKIKTAPCNL